MFRSQVYGCRRCGNLQTAAVSPVRNLRREGVRLDESRLEMSVRLLSHRQTSNAFLLECQPRAAWCLWNRVRGRCRGADEKKPYGYSLLLRGVHSLLFQTLVGYPHQ